MTDPYKHGRARWAGTTRTPRRSGVLVAVAVLTACGGEVVEEPTDPRLQNPLLRASQFNETAPRTFRVLFETTNGDFVIEVHRDWAPIGADRFYNLVKREWYDGVRFHRVLTDFMVQWGIHDEPYVNAIWQDKLLADDPATQSNTRGRVSFAKGGANSRTVQVFINYQDNPSLDERGFSPIGEVVEGMDVVDGLYAEYGEGPPRGEGIYQAMAMARGAEYYDEEFPELDRIVRATVAFTPP
jgi:peptidyl-prolyl cis-trans isomerase A (cyclophilin A)